MNHSLSSMQLFDKAIASFLYFKSAEGLRDRSIDSYQRILNQCAEHWGPVNVTKLTSQDVSAYLSWLRTDYVPKRYGGKTHTLSPKTLQRFAMRCATANRDQALVL
jgi:integrase/recombinase XerD